MLALRAMPSATVLALAIGPAWAQAPSAIVEEVDPAVTAVEFMDYVSPGQIIEVPGGARLVLGYFRSCHREAVTGGRVTVGVRESEVVGGQVERSTVICESRPLILGRQEVQRSGAMAFRAPPKKNQPREILIFTRQPVFDGVRPGVLRIVRADGGGTALEIDVSASDLVNDRIYDFARAGRVLDADGIYRVTQADSGAAFKIMKSHSANVRFVIGRLVRLTGDP